MLDKISCPNCGALVEMGEFVKTKTTLAIVCNCSAYFYVWRENDGWNIGKYRLVDLDQLAAEDLEMMKEEMEA